jgi:predicted nucleic acid-binding protein
MQSPPLRNNQTELLSTYDLFFSRGSLTLAEITASVIERATDLRARHGLKTPDAIHMATAIELQADLFLTGDRDLAPCSDIKVEVV